MARREHRVLRLVVLLLIPILALSRSTSAQATNKGEISGVVFDAAGAIVPGALVSLTLLSTGFTRETAATELGSYVFPLVDPGEYELSASKPGFKVEKKSPVQVTAQSKVVVDFGLQIGDLSDHVTVEAHGSVLRSRDVGVSSSVPEWQLKELPLNDKLLAEFTRLEAGVTPRELTTAESGPNSDSGGFLHGLRQFFVRVTLDGGHFDDPTWPGGTMTNTQGISFEAVKEFTVVKGNPDATQASAAGYTINIVTRSGTNRVQGSLFEYFRDDAMDARNFFDGPRTQELRRNQFGGAVGGPIAIRRGRDFFFGNYEGFRRTRFQTVTPIVPTEYLLAQVPGGADNGYLRELMTVMYPRPAAGTFGATALVAPATSRVNLGMNRDMFVLRSDNQLHGNHRLLVRYNSMDGDTAPGVSVGSGLQGTAIGFNWRFHNVLAGLTSIVSRHAVNEFRVTYNRVLHHFDAEPTPAALVALGFDPTANTSNGVPFIFFAGTGLTGAGVLPFVPKRRHSDVFELSDTFSKVMGSHNLTFGGSSQFVQSHWLMGENTRRSTVFIGFGPPFDSSPFGLTTGRFLSQTQNLLLDPSSPVRRFRFDQIAGFIQDTYQPTPAWTLLFGLRYSVNTPITEADRRLSNAYPVNAAGQPIEDGDINNETISPLTLSTVGDTRFSAVDTNNLAPSAGVTWRPRGRGPMVFKGGYSVSYGSPFVELIRLVGFNPPFGFATVLGASRYGTFADPARLTTRPALNVYNPANVDPSVHSWNVAAEYELNTSTVVRVGYVGNRARNLWDTRQPNYGSGYTRQRPNPEFSVINLTETRASSSYDGARFEFSRRLDRDLGFQVTYIYGKARDDISAAVSTLCPNGFGCLPTDQLNLSENRGTADFDVRQTAVANFVYELPFGDGRRFALGRNTLASTLISGWSVGGILSYWNGVPFDVLSGIDNNGDGVANDRARILPGADPRDALTSRSGRGSSTQYLDPAAVGAVLSQTTGTPLPRNFFRGPAIVNLDVRVHKRTGIGHGRTLDFGAEIFNALNHTNFSNPVNSLSSPTFGRIVGTATRSREVQLGVRLTF